jgi:hypothetical protein
MTRVLTVRALSTLCFFGALLILAFVAGRHSVAPMKSVVKRPDSLILRVPIAILGDTPLALDLGMPVDENIEGIKQTFSFRMGITR